MSLHCENAPSILNNSRALSTITPGKTTMYTTDTSPAVFFNKNLSPTMPQAPYRMAWFNLNYLTINPDKTQALVLGPIASNYEFAFRIDNASVSVSQHLTILEVTLDKLAVGKTYRMSGRQQQ